MTIDPTDNVGRGLDIIDAVDAVAGLVEANRDASHGLRMMVEILEDLPIAAELREKAEIRDGFASKLAVLMARYGAGADIPEGTSFKGKRFGWRMQVGAALRGDNRTAVLRIADKGNKEMRKEYDRALDVQLPDDVRKVIVAQLREIEETGEWVRSNLDDSED
jgi:uncharacterized protein (TIGR02284 family)